MKRIARKIPNVIDLGIRESWLSLYFLPLQSTSMAKEFLSSIIGPLPAITSTRLTL
jgi:hypothetical protein